MEELLKFTVQQYLSQHAGTWPPEVEAAATTLLRKVGALLSDPKCPSPNAGLRSGCRPAEFNQSVPGAASHSQHTTGHAVDRADDNEALDKWLTDKVLELYGLYREAPGATRSWCHLQDVAPKSGRRTFIPSRKYA